LKKELLRRQNRLVLLQSQQYSLSDQMSPFSTNPTIGTAIKSTDWQDATKQSKNMQLPNGSSSQHAQSHSDTYGSPQNAARRLKVVDLLNISSSQHARSAPYVTATGPSTQPFGHTPTSACTSNTDAMYSPTETEEQVPDAIYSPYSPTAMEEQVPDAIYSPYSPNTTEEQAPRARQHRTIQLKKQADSGSRTLSFRARRHHNARALGPANTLPLSYKLYDGKESFAGCSDCTNATHAHPRQYNKRSQKFTSRQMVREGGFFHHSRQKRICSDVTPYPLRSWQFQSILQASMVLQLRSQEASRKWILSLEVMAKHSVQRIQQS
jgi:hypothetical protein